MMQRIFSRENLTRALRMVLVFALVFWSSFRLECLAFAADDVPEGKVLGNYEVRQGTPFGETGDVLFETVVRDLAGMMEGAEQSGTLRVAINGGTMQFAAMPTWKEAQQEPEPQTHTVTYTDGVGGAAFADQQYPFEEGAEEPQFDGDPYYEGYEFAGWERTTTEEGNIVYTATWTVVQDPVVNPDPIEDEETGNPEEDQTINPESEGTQVEPLDAQPQSDPGDVDVRPAPAAVTTQDDENPVVKFMKWEVNDPSIAEITVDESTGVATLTGKSVGQAIVSCYPDPEKLGEDAIDPAIRGQILTFAVQVVYISSVEIYRADELVEDQARVDTLSEPLKLTDEDRTDFGFWAKVAGGNESDSFVFESRPQNPLSKTSNGLLHDLVWSVVDENGEAVGSEVATITADGSLTLEKNASATVLCTSPDQGQDGKPIAASVGVTTKSEEEPPPIEDDTEAIQGGHHPQDPLTVKILRPAKKKSDEQEGDSESNDENGSDSQENPEGPNVEGQAEEGAEEGAGDGGDGTGNGGEGDDATPAETEEVIEISAADFESVPGGVTDPPLTYTMYVDGKEQTVTGSGCSLQGILQKAGLYQGKDHDAEHRQSNIETIEFVNFLDEHVSISWSDLVDYTHRVGEYASEDENADSENESGGEYILVARDSRVKGPEPQDNSDDGDSGMTPQADEEDGDSGDSGDNEDGNNEDGNNEDNNGDGGDNGSNSNESPAADDGTKLFDNTRFRILFNQDSDGLLGDAGKLRWVNTIVVHMKGEPEEDESQPDEKLGISIDYNPVLKGETAMLVARASKTIGGLTFGYTWYRSTDEGKTWTEVGSEASQTLYVLHDDEHLGNWYYVKLNTDDKNDKGDDRWTKSDPVVIKELDSDDWSVQLDYVPPFAGDFANFTAHVTGKYENAEGLEYIWEYSTDGCETWNNCDEVPSIMINADRTVCSVKTQPITSSSSSDDDDEDEEGSDSEDEEPINPIYFHVKVVKDSEMRVSPAHMLSVKPGENPDGPPAPGPDDTPKPDNPTNPDTPQNPENPSDPGNPENPSDSSNVEVPIDPDNFTEVMDPSSNDYPEDDYEPEYEETPQVIPVESVTNNAEEVADGDTSTLIIDEDVSQKVNEQRKKEAAAKNSTPGAKWIEVAAPTNDDIRRILDGNPFAPFAAPLTPKPFHSAAMIPAQ